MTVTVGWHVELWEEAEQRWDKRGNGGNRYACGAVATLPGMVGRLSVFESGGEDDAHRP